MKEQKLSVVMPAYNEEGSIEQAVRGIHETLEDLGIEHEIIVSEDGSTDGTKDILQGLEREELITAATGGERRGYTGALKKGLERADGDYLLFMDGDGQYYPSDVEELWRRRDEADVVIGRRDQRADSFGRRLISDGFRAVVRVYTDCPDIQDTTSSFRLMTNEAAEIIIPEIRHMRDSSWTEFGIRAHRSGLEQLEVSVGHRERPGDGDTRIYHLSNLPKVIFRQLRGLHSLKKELKKR